MNKNPLPYVAGLMAAAGLVFLFTLESAATGLMFIVSAMCITLVMLYRKNKSSAPEQPPKPGPDGPADKQEKKNR